MGKTAFVQRFTTACKSMGWESAILAVDMRDFKNSDTKTINKLKEIEKMRE